MKAKSFEAVKRVEARERMAALRRAGKSRRAALKEQRAASMFGGADKWRITNLPQMLAAMGR
jgi:hypothetical protein